MPIFRTFRPPRRDVDDSLPRVETIHWLRDIDSLVRDAVAGVPRYTGLSSRACDNMFILTADREVRNLVIVKCVRVVIWITRENSDCSNNGAAAQPAKRRIQYADIGEYAQMEDLR